MTIRELKAALSEFSDDQHVQVLRMCVTPNIFGDGSSRRGEQLIIQAVAETPGWHTRSAGAPDIVRIIVDEQNAELSKADLSAIGAAKEAAGVE
jgi:hypothetical protein